MSRFITCSIDRRMYGSSELINHAVNIDLCRKIQKSRLQYYPDNTGIPSIKFAGCDAEWVYKTDAERDADYLRIISEANKP